MYRKLLMLSYLCMVWWFIKLVKVNVLIYGLKMKVCIYIVIEFEKCYKNYSFVEFD